VERAEGRWRRSWAFPEVRRRRIAATGRLYHARRVDSKAADGQQVDLHFQ
jgi:hypothetical protein